MLFDSRGPRRHRPVIGLLCSFWPGFRGLRHYRQARSYTAGLTAVARLLVPIEIHSAGLVAGALPGDFGTRSDRYERC